MVACRSEDPQGNDVFAPGDDSDDSPSDTDTDASPDTDTDSGAPPVHTSGDIAADHTIPVYVREPDLDYDVFVVAPGV